MNKKIVVILCFFTFSLFCLSLVCSCGKQSNETTTTTTLPSDLDGTPFDQSKITTKEVTMDLGDGTTASISREYVNNQVIIKVAADKTISDLLALLPSGYTLAGKNMETNTYQITIPADKNVAQAITAIKQLSSSVVSKVGENPVVSAQIVPCDPTFTSRWTDDRWGFISIEAENAWDITTGETSVSLAIVDTGINLTHQDFDGRINSTYKKNFIAGNSDPTDDSGHGTAVAGIAAGTGNNGLYIAGTNWNSKIMAVKAINSNDKSDAYTICNAMTYALTNEAKVINCSFGVYLDPVSDEAIIEQFTNVAQLAYDKNAVIIAAAGNEGRNAARFYPAALASLNNSPVIAVGGYGQSGGRWSDSHGSSNYGTTVNLCAPAEKIYTTWYDGNVQTGKWGTSLAAPFVSGTAALIYSLYPGSTSLGVKLALTDDEGSDSISADKAIGRKLNVWKALLRSMYYNAQAVVSVASTVGGATIYVDGVSTGKTTTTNGFARVVVASGSHTIKASKTGYTDASTSVSCTKGTNTEVTLNPLAGAEYLTGSTSTYLKADNGKFWLRTDYTNAATRNLLNQIGLTNQSNWLKRAIYPSPCLTQAEPFWDGIKDHTLSVLKNTSTIAAYQSQFTVYSGSKELKVTWKFIMPYDKKYAIWVASFESVGSDKTITVDNPSNYNVQDVYFCYPLQPTTETNAYVTCESDSVAVPWSASSATDYYNSSNNRHFSIYNNDGCLTFGYFNSYCSTAPYMFYLNSEMSESGNTYKSLFTTIKKVELSASFPSAQWVGVLAFHSSVAEAASLFSDAQSNAATYLSAIQ